MEGRRRLNSSFLISTGILKKDMWFNRSIAFALILILLGAALPLFPASGVEAFSTNPNDYFSYTYTFTFSKTTVAPGEAFYVTVTGQATCTQDLPVPGSWISAQIVSRIVARLQPASPDVVLNANYTLSYSGFPGKKGESTTMTVQVPLVFPGDAAGGSYSVIGLIIEAKATFKPLGIDVDVKGSLPSPQTMGVVTCSSSGGGGGGGGGGGVPIYGPEKPQPATDLTPFMKDGEFKEEATAKSTDGMAKLTIAVGTKFGGTGVVMIVVDKKEEPNPPEAGFIIGTVYNLGPDGATFSQPVRLTFSFDPAALPDDIKKKDLVIAWWKTNDSKWVTLEDCEVDETANTVTGTVDHFTMFSLIAQPAPEPQPTPVPATTQATTPATATTPVPVATPTTPSSPAPSIQSPAAFIVSDLTITPSVVIAGETVTVTVFVSNTGDLSGVYEAVVMVDGTPVARQNVTLAGESSQRVDFEFIAARSGDHAVAVDNLLKRYSVAVPVEAGKQVNWWLVYGLIGMGLALGGSIIVFIQRKLSRSKGRA